MINKKLTMILLSSVLATGAANAKTLYGVTTTSYEEGNAMIVSVDTDNLSADKENPTAFKEISTFEHAADFMAGTSAGPVYYCFYNTYDGETGVSMQYFGTLEFATGEFHQIAEANHAISDDVTDVVDMVYDAANGGLLALDRQYIPSQTKFVSTLQKINTSRGTMQELICLDDKYAGICYDGTGGFYVVKLERESGDIYHPIFYKADKRFKLTQLETNAAAVNCESSFAHSLALDGNKLYFANGQTITILDLESGKAENRYVEKEFYGITFEEGLGNQGGVEEIGATGDGSVKYYDLQGHKVSKPGQPGIYIRRHDGKSDKIIVR